MSTNPLLPVLRQQLELQEKSLALQKQLIQALSMMDEDSHERNCATTDVRSMQLPNVESRAESTWSRPASGDREPLLEESEVNLNAPTPSVLGMYCRFFLSDASKCFTEHPSWEVLTTESMTGPRIREKIIATFETLMVFYTLMFSIGVGVLQGLSKLHSMIDFALLFVSFVMPSLCFVSITIIFCTLKMVLAISDCNLKIWCKANLHVFETMSWTHNMIVILTPFFMCFLVLRALPADQTFPMPVEIGIKVGVVMFALVLGVVIGYAVCAPARSAGHTGATSEVPICSDAVCTQATPEDAKRILYHEAFEFKLEKLVDFYREGGGQEGNTVAPDESPFVRRGGIIKRRVKRNV